MLRNIIFLLLLSGTFGLATAAPVPVPAAPQLAAQNYILLDPNSDYVITAKGADQRVEPASITKLMTAYVVFYELASGSTKLTDEVLVSETAWRTQGSRMFIEARSRVSIEELLKGMIIQSGNDASVALAEHIAGGEASFADLMNQHAQRLSLTGSHFVNSTGLPDADHYTTVNDIATIAKAIINEYPQYYAWYTERSYTYNGIKQYNRNRLLWRDETVDGIKTGHTDSAGYCLVSSAERNGMRLLAVIMGTKSEEARAKQSQQLLHYGFRFYETHQLYGAGEALTEARIWKGDAEKLPLGVAQDLYITVPRGQYKNLKASMDLVEDILAPAQKGSKFGQLVIRLADEVVLQRPLVAMRSVNTGSILQRFSDEVKMWFR